MRNTKKISWKKLFALKISAIFDFWLFFHKSYTFSFIHQKRFYENQKFNFPDKIYEILKKS